MRKVALQILGAVCLGALFLVTVTWNRAEVLVPLADGGTLVILADGDCHSRLQRAAMVAERPGLIIRSHDFENHPEGTLPHTTAPFDYLVAALGVVVQPMDLAGVWISPLLGLVTLLFLLFWSVHLDLRPRWPMLLLFAVSPALTHAFALGRPDHQSLLVLLTTVALAAQWAMVRTNRPAWAWASGTTWGLALWVSWYEPFILLTVQELSRLLVLRGRAWPLPWRRALILVAGLALGAWALEGFRHPWPDRAVRELFPAWSTLLGELQSVTPATMFGWTGWLLLPAPLLLVWDYHRRRDPLALLALAMLTVATALTGWQARWNPWLVATFCLALPWILAPLRKLWIVWTVFLVSLWPVAAVWEDRLQPDEVEAGRRTEKIIESALIADVAAFLADQPRGGVLAPWWISPALARQSGQPHVAGTSHQSLPGIADTARFFLAEQPDDALVILRSRQVAYVVSDDPDRVIPTSTALLGASTPGHPLITRLDRGRDVPDFLEPVFANPFFRVYRVRDE